jgi:hypothetical protein
MHIQTTSEAIMKRHILTLVALLLLGITAADAQITSSPLEPGMYDWLKSRHAPGVQLLDNTRMTLPTLSAEWISPEQITLTAVVAEFGSMTETLRSRIERRVSEYNVNAPVGTLVVVDGGTIRMIHFLNPKLSTPSQMAVALATFDAALEEQRKSFDRAMASR